MRSSRTAAVALLGITVIAVVATQPRAYPRLAQEQKTACVTCHANPAGGAVLSETGKGFKADGKPPLAGGARAAEYVGAHRCKICHSTQHQNWAMTAHARAWDTLLHPDTAKATAMAAALKLEIHGSPAETEACVTCHVTGFHLTGGYPQADSLRDANLVNVTCESCHGPASLHLTAPRAEKKKFIQRIATANLCTQCHTPATSPSFKFADYVLRGTHVAAPDSVR